MAYQTDYFSPDGIPDDEPISMCMMPDNDDEEPTEKPAHVYSPFSPYYTETK